MSSIKVYLQVIVPKRALEKEKEGHFVCYDANSPIPWKEKLFAITDDKSRSWFCHEWPHSVSDAESLVMSIRKEYPEVIRRSTPIVFNLIVVRANGLDELKNLLSGTSTSDN